MAYKMRGHLLPGINQRSEGNTDLSDGRSGSSPFQESSPAKQGLIWGPKGDERMMDAFPGDETKIEKDRRQKTYRKPDESKYQSDVRRNKEQRKYEKNIPKRTEAWRKNMEAIKSAKKEKSPAKHFTGLDHSNTDPAHKTPPITPSDTTTTKKETLPVGTLNEEKTKKWDGKKWVIIKKKR